MSNDTKEAVDQIDPGPIEIRLSQDGGAPELVGYALIQVDSEQVYNWYFVMKADAHFPLPNKVGYESYFKGIDAPDTSAKEFYDWVIDQETLGKEVQTPKAEESFSTWKP